jgi:hypothetical protein
MQVTNARQDGLTWYGLSREATITAIADNRDRQTLYQERATAACATWYGRLVYKVKRMLRLRTFRVG